MTVPPPLRGHAEAVLDACRAQKLTLAVAESCTGGLISAALTAVPGSSDVIERGFVTYANTAKIDMLGVSPETLASFGAVSEETARAMATGVLENAPVDLAASVTGIAGPGGGSDDKPVGLVHMAVARRGGTVQHARHVFSGDRDGVRNQAAEAVLTMLAEAAAQS